METMSQRKNLTHWHQCRFWTHSKVRERSRGTFNSAQELIQYTETRMLKRPYSWAGDELTERCTVEGGRDASAKT